jgi:hypothetical protein
MVAIRRPAFNWEIPMNRQRTIIVLAAIVSVVSLSATDAAAAPLSEIDCSDYNAAWCYKDCPDNPEAECALDIFGTSCELESATPDCDFISQNGCNWDEDDFDNYLACEYSGTTEG